MTATQYSLLAAFIFGLVAVLQIVRAVMGLPVSIGQTSIPIWGSWVAVVLSSSSRGLAVPHHEANPEERDMRWLHTAVIVILAAAILIFVAQNFQSVTVAFLGLRFSLPLSLLALIIYALGLITGGGRLVRWAWARRAPNGTP